MAEQPVLSVSIGEKMQMTGLEVADAVMTFGLRYPPGLDRYPKKHVSMHLVLTLCFYVVSSCNIFQKYIILVCVGYLGPNTDCYY